MLAKVLFTENDQDDGIDALKQEWDTFYAQHPQARLDVNAVWQRLDGGLGKLHGKGEDDDDE